MLLLRFVRVFGIVLTDSIDHHYLLLTGRFVAQENGNRETKLSYLERKSESD